MDFPPLARKNIRGLKPYHSKEMPCSVKLDANESPYPPNVSVGPAFAGNLNRYPDPEAKELKKAIVKGLGVGVDNILTGNGSDELIYYLIITFGGPVLCPVPTFSMYEILSRAVGEKFTGIPLDRDFDLDTDKMLAAIKKHRPKLVFLSSPNNPTGNCFSPDRILRIVEAAGGVVVVDEAYQPFSSEKGFMPLLKDYKNLAILRTLSKVGFAALRVGFLAADRDLIREVNKVRLPFNLNAISQAMAAQALGDRKRIRVVVKLIASERERLFNALQQIEGVTPYPSEANFILMKVVDPKRIYKQLLRSGVLVRNLDNLIKGALRVTIGTPGENTIFLEALNKAMGRKR